MAKSKIKIRIKPEYKHRVPHKPTRVHKSKKQYNRQREKQKFRKEVWNELQ